MKYKLKEFQETVNFMLLCIHMFHETNKITFRSIPVQIMVVVLAFNERTMSYYLFREASELNFALVIKPIEEDSNKFLSAAVNRLPRNTEYKLKPIAKFDTSLGFLKHKNSKPIKLC